MLSEGLLAPPHPPAFSVPRMGLATNSQTCGVHEPPDPHCSSNLAKVPTATTNFGGPATVDVHPSVYLFPD